MNFETLLLIVTVLLTSLTTGVFFGYAISVNWALHRLKDDGYVRTMQHINRVIQNPWFFVAFFFPVFLLPLVTLLYGPMGSLQFFLFLGASLAYVFGTFGITIVGNVPLNEQLDKFPIETASSKGILEARTRYEHPWNRLHAIRTILGVVAVVLVTWGAIL